jgi:tRNA threonylcarbamoyladenosine biosynthesis protein TsaB
MKSDQIMLAIDTATRCLSVALANDAVILAERTWYTANQHSVELAPALEQMLAQTGLVARDLTAIAVAQGPGSFTGVRIGIGVAKGLALALQIPLIAVPTLDIVAAATPFFAGTLLVVIQAGRGRIITGNYEWHEKRWVVAGEPALMTWEALIEGIKERTLVNGEIDAHGQAVLQKSTIPVCLLPMAMQLRRAGFLAQLGLDRLDQGYQGDPAMVMPVYLKQL